MSRSLVLMVVAMTLLFSTSCDDINTNIEEQLLWIGPEKVSCIGAFEQECYQVQSSNELTANWEFFYNTIEGFDEQYEPTYIYRIKVKVNEVQNPPQDVSGLAYKLIEIFSKEKQ